VTQALGMQAMALKNIICCPRWFTYIS